MSGERGLAISLTAANKIITEAAVEVLHTLKHLTTLFVFITSSGGGALSRVVQLRQKHVASACMKAIRDY